MRRDCIAHNELTVNPPDGSVHWIRGQVGHGPLTVFVEWDGIHDQWLIYHKISDETKKLPGSTEMHDVAYAACELHSLLLKVHNEQTKIATAKSAVYTFFHPPEPEPEAETGDLPGRGDDPIIA